MSNIYEVFNVTNDHELSKVFDRLELSYNEMTNIDYIVETMNKENARTKILELMAGSADGNYEICLEQFGKSFKKRVLKEESGLNLNQVMELNQLVELVAAKMSANQEQCLEGIYNIISQKAGVNAAKTFIGMVQQSSVNQSSLKFNTDLVVDGKNLAQVIYALKNEIEIFCNSVKKEESEKEEVKESLNESYSKYQEIVQELDKAVDDVNDINILKSISDKVNELMGRVKNMNEANELATLKTTLESKINSLMGSKPALEESCLATQVAANACGEDTFNGLLDTIKPTLISITVNKEGDIIPCEDNCCEEPCCDCNDNCCCEPCCDCEDNCANEVPCVQPLTLSPTAVDAPILKKPNSAEVTSAITALASHSNDIKSDSRENNIENLQTINTLLGNISNYFNQLLGESFKPGDFVVRKNSDNGETFEILKKYEQNGKTVYDVKSRVEDTDIHTITKGLDGEDLEKNYELDSDDSYDGEDVKESLTETKHVQICAYDILYDLPHEMSGTISYDEDDLSSNYEQDDLITDRVREWCYEDANIYPSEISYDIINEWDDDEDESEDSGNNEEPVWDGEDEEINETLRIAGVQLNESEMTSKEFARRLYDSIKDDEDFRIVWENVKGTDDGYDKALEYRCSEWAEDVLGGKMWILDDEYQDCSWVEVGSYVLDLDGIYNDWFDYIKNDPSSNDYLSTEDWDGEDEEELNEETVYDHSWFEVEGQKYPKRTKNGVEGLPIKETCSAGATCAASVASVPSVKTKKKSKPRKPETADLSLFKESIKNDCPSTLSISNRMVSYKIVEGKGYLYIGNGIVKASGKNAILEAVDDIYNNCLDIDVLEGYSPYEMEILLEDDINPDLGDVNSTTTITPDEKKKQQQELDLDLQKNPNKKVGVVTGDTDGEIKQNQEFVGVDDHDENNKKYIVKDPSTGEVSIVDYNQIKLSEI